MLGFNFTNKLLFWSKQNRRDDIDICNYMGYNELNGGVLMRIGEVSLLTNNVITLANFYKTLLQTENGSNDDIHQTIISEETMLTVYNDGSVKNNTNQNICLAFTVDDINKEYDKLVKLGVDIIEKPTSRPWGAINMSFYDPDRNIVYLRSFNK